MNQLRTLHRWGPRGRTATVYCEATGCDENTREGKPFCPKHVEEHPYVQQLIAQLEGQEAEIERVGRLGPRAVDPEGLTALEILQFLRVHGKRTVPRLARELNMDLKVLESYSKALKRKGFVTLTPNRRHVDVIKLEGQADDFADPDAHNADDEAHSQVA